ncbi:MAG: PA2779 family protein [Acidobacteria bacterium]|nr:PA2779 family protein [Acidobacteriota bacterium]MDA1236350.1 PA2779 family protein [Acidobacteriota bacterium]
MFRQTVAYLTLAAFLFAPLKGFSAEQIEHLIPAAELQLELAAAELQRQGNVREVERILDREDAQLLLVKAGLSASEVREAIPQLDDETLAVLADQSRQLNEDVAGGFVGGIIILLILALVLAVVLVRNTSFFD